MGKVRLEVLLPPHPLLPTVSVDTPEGPGADAKGQSDQSHMVPTALKRCRTPSNAAWCETTGSSGDAGDP